jgi:hypothetical protein
MEADLASQKREEFGFMKGKIVYVRHPATTAALMRNFENYCWFRLTNAGPVTGCIAMERDTRTDGFQWSTAMGP